MKKKKDAFNFIVNYRDVDPYTGFIDGVGVVCKTCTHKDAIEIIGALLESSSRNPVRQYWVDEMEEGMDEGEERSWWKL